MATPLRYQFKLYPICEKYQDILTALGFTFTGNSLEVSRELCAQMSAHIESRDIPGRRENGQVVVETHSSHYSQVFTTADYVVRISWIEGNEPTKFDSVDITEVERTAMDFTAANFEQFCIDCAEAGKSYSRGQLMVGFIQRVLYTRTHQDVPLSRITLVGKTGFKVAWGHKTLVKQFPAWAVDYLK